MYDADDATAYAHEPRRPFIAERQLSEQYAAEHARLTQLARRVGTPPTASHTSALRLLGIELPERYEKRFDPHAVHLAVGTSQQRHIISGAVVHLADELMLAEHTRSQTMYFNVVGPELALAQMAAVLSMLELVVLGDCMMRRGAQKHTTKARIAEFLAHSSAFVGKRKLVRALPLMRENTDSSYETRTRIALACRGLGSAEVNVDIASDRVTPWSVDMAYTELMTVLEYDGSFHMTDVRQAERDKEKRSWLRARHWEVMEVTKARLADSEARDRLADDVASFFAKALDHPVLALPCIPIERLADTRRRYRAPGLEHPQLDRYFRNTSLHSGVRTPTSP